MSRVAKLALAATVLVTLALGAVASAATTPAGGPVRVFVTTTSGTRGNILVTGAIGDYGTTLSVNKDGKVNPNGVYQKVRLKKGTFWVNATGLNNSLNKGQPSVNNATCSVVFSGSGPGTLFNGTGLYTGISGTVRITATFAGIAPRYPSGAKKGQCNFGSNNILGQYQSIVGAGRVKFG